MAAVIDEKQKTGAGEERKTAIGKFPLRLMPSIRKTAEIVSAREGVSLNQFINVAVAEKLVHLEHDEWVSNRKKRTNQLAEEALRLLDKSGGKRVEPEDELPDDGSCSSQFPGPGRS